MDNLIRPHRPTLGVLPGWQAYSGTLDSFLERVLHGAQSAAHQLDCNILLGCGVLQPGMFTTTNRPALPMFIPDVDFVPIGPWNCDGILVIPPIEKPAVMAYFQEVLATGFPLVFAGDWKAGPGVMVDNEDGVRQAVFHLVEHGHRRIAFIAGSTRLGGDSEYRLIGYKNAIQEAGLAFDPQLIEYGYHDDEGGKEALMRLLERKREFSAVIASNDQSAVGALIALQEAGLQVPQDVALVGFDDRLEARAQAPSLTSIHFPMYELGYRAAELLYRYIFEGKAGRDQVLLPTRLVIRELCGCLPGDLRQTTSAPAARKARSRSLIHEVQHEISGAVYNDLHRVSMQEIDRFSRILVEKFISSLEKTDHIDFQKEIQGILEFTASREDDLQAWQKAITILRLRLGDLLSGPLIVKFTLAEDYLDQARVAISNIAEREASRRLVASSRMSAVNGWMSAHFFSVTDETELFEVLNRYLPQIGIQHALAFFYEAEGDDPVARSRLQGEPDFPEELRWFETRHFPPAGLYPPEKPYNLALLPLQSPEGSIGFIAFQGDALEWNALITTQLLAALRGIRLYQTAVEERRNAEESNRMKGRFLSVVSHELRTPLNLISGLSNMLLKERQNSAGDDEAEGARVNWDDLERIFISAQHLDGLIRDVLDLARIDVGKLNLACEPLNLNEVFEAAGVIGEQLAREKQLDWHSSIDQNLPRVWGDRTRLRQVILNLINNAVKFTSQGEIVLSATVRGDEVVVSVADTGLGIPVDEQKLIFDEFSQSDRTAARGYGGLGLGLSICKRLVEMHGGTIKVDSSGREGKGSVFSFTLPVLRETPVKSVLERQSDARQVVLLVQDPQAGELIKAQLVSQNISTSMYQVGKDSDWLSWVILEDPDAVVLDFGLTAQSGWEILKQLKENQATQDLPVMFYSLQNEGDCAELLEFDYLMKPLSGDDLTQALTSQGLLGKNGGNGKKAILVADDDPDVLALHTRHIQALSPGFQILQAQNGNQALAKIRENRPVLVLLDLMMPELDGFGVLEALQADADIRSTPVIVVTGQVLTEEDMQRLNKGVSSVLSKGMFTPQETLEHISSVLERRRKPGIEIRRAVMKAMAFIQVHYADGISRGDVAAHVGLSERHLTRCFHQETGLTPITYLNRFRVQRAKELMRAGKTSITEIALDVGFSNSGYFTKVFRAETGLSPREFIQGE